MTLDSVVLWLLTLGNSLGLLLLVRQVARLPQFHRRPGPSAGDTVPDWNVRTVDGGVFSSSEAGGQYTLLFVSPSCGPCRALFADLVRQGRPHGPIYVIAQGEAGSLPNDGIGPGGPVYDRFFVANETALYDGLQVPGTPYAVAVRDQRVVSAAVASTTNDLARVTDALDSGRSG